MDIKIKYFSNVPPLEQVEGSDWIDLRVAQDVSLLGNKFKVVPFGVGIKLPKGYEAHIVPRSSTFKKWGVIQTNHMGVVDESYCGDNDQWRWPMYVLERRPKTKIPKGTRVAQFRIVKKQPKIVFKMVDSFGAPDRGGFGSTGEK